jgi:hypothetical protein
MVRKWSTGPVSLSYTIPYTGLGQRAENEV